METTKLALILVILLVGGICNPDTQGAPFTYHWEIDETPEGSESATIIEPIEVTVLDKQIQVPSHSASLALMYKYSVYLGPEWDPGYAYRLLQTFESILPAANDPRHLILHLSASIWKLSDRHVQDDIEVESQGDQKIVTLSKTSFEYATPLLAEIEGVRGRYFSKKLHRAVVRFVTDNGADRYALGRILQERYAVNINIPDYSELTRYTTSEHAGRFSEFKNEEILALISIFEEFPQGMHRVSGLKYLVRRLDGTDHPTHPGADAVAWTGTGYIEFMESAFKEKGLDAIHRLILHEKAHFLWEYLFDEQLKQDWIELGGWFENPDDVDGWSTTKQVEFVSAYAHAKNPDEDMAESISYYIVRPDKLRSHSPAKYEFIQNRVMHGTRYISNIREDLTFEVYNLWPDHVYPGRIIRVDIQVDGEPEEDKLITVEIEIHGENALDAAQRGFARIWSEERTYLDLWVSPITPEGQHVSAGHILRGTYNISKYTANGYWRPDTIRVYDAQGNERHNGQTDFGWKLYINNPLADTEAPQYIPNSMQLSLSDATTKEGRAYQILTARWKFIEKNGISGVYAELYDANVETYSRRLTDWGEYNQETEGVWEATTKLEVPDYFPNSTYKITRIVMQDLAKNRSKVYFTEGGDDELPASIEIQTTNPDTEPPVLDVNQIGIEAEPTQPAAPNGETRVDITFRIKDNISGHRITYMSLRNPQGVMLSYDYYDPDLYKIYFTRDPTVYETYHKTIILPVGSPPGIWGLAEMTIKDKAQNVLRVDFTEIVRFEVEEGAAAAPIIASLPDDTQLLPNYPNPFNPETWIPYQLANASDVHITIYDTKGMLIHTLALGHQSAGYYTGRSRAVYWDGRNSLGESVASGVYFYRLQTDESSLMRKMVILK